MEQCLIRFVELLRADKIKESSVLYVWYQRLNFTLGSGLVMYRSLRWCRF